MTDRPIIPASGLPPAKPVAPSEPVRRLVGSLSSSNASRLARADRVKTAGSSIGSRDEHAWAAEAERPAQLLANPRWMGAEWAWRRVLQSSGAVVQQADSGRLPAPSPPQPDAPASAGGGAHPYIGDTGSGEGSAAENVKNGTLAQAVAGLWTLFASYAGEEEDAHEWVIPAGQLERAGWPSDQPLLVFADVHSPHWFRHERLGRWLIRDRWISAVCESGGVLQGGGLFWPGHAGSHKPASDPSAASQTAFGQGESRRTAAGAEEAVRWFAERHSRTNSAGGRVDRIRLELRLNGRRLEIWLLSAGTSLSVHVGCDDDGWCQRLRNGAAHLAQALERHGRRLERCTAGPLQMREEGRG
ncbi:MAG: hypothetical protein IRZ33_05940 [Alicyclobacillaceae bacterium]|nr:hypothetical protein [Alicyclobacillaceae bacterium]